MIAEKPLVSVVLTTRDRPTLLQVALGCYRHQTYAPRELIIVDDSETSSVDEAALAAINGRLIRVQPGTQLGIKLNIGTGAARGSLIMKMDDDDYYAPDYLDTMVGELLRLSQTACRRTVVFLMGFLFFDLEHWELRRSVENNMPGATLIYGRKDWEECPFRPVPGDEDVWFMKDQIGAGALALPITAPESFVAIRHRGHGGSRGHTWTHQYDGQSLEEYLKARPIYEKPPEELLPNFALSVYQRIHAELTAVPSKA